MVEQNVEFIEEYKRLDKLCKDILQSNEGISTYLLQMENTPLSKTLKITTWQNTYNLLKHLRWLRNQLVHEKSFYDDFCTDTDIKDLRCLYNSIASAKDPLSRVSGEQSHNHAKNNPNEHAKEDVSLWDKIISKIKEWFS